MMISTAKLVKSFKDHRREKLVLKLFKGTVLQDGSFSSAYGSFAVEGHPFLRFI